MSDYKKTTINYFKEFIKRLDMLDKKLNILLSDWRVALLAAVLAGLVVSFFQIPGR